MHRVGRPNDDIVVIFLRMQDFETRSCVELVTRHKAPLRQLYWITLTAFRRAYCGSRRDGAAMSRACLLWCEHTGAVLRNGSGNLAEQ